MLLTVDELSEYAPSITSCDLTKASPLALIAHAQALATGSRGSNRSLELGQHTETLTTERSMLFCLKYWPIVIDEDHPVGIRYRFVDASQFDLDRWQTMAADQYEINDNGRLSVYLENLALSNFGRRSRYLRPHQKVPRIELEVTYWGGFDFTGDSDDVVQMKAALGAIVSLQAAATTALEGVANAAGEVSEVEVDKDFAVKFSGSSDKNAIAASQITALGGSSSPLDVYLSVFRKYRAKVLPV